MKIGEVVDQLGIPASTIRFYEKEGLINRQQRVSGQRQFDKYALFTLRFVQLALATGFTIAETKSLVENYDCDPNPANLWKQFAQAKQAELRTQIKKLQQMDQVLTESMKCECVSIEACVDLVTLFKRC